MRFLKTKAIVSSSSLKNEDKVSGLDIYENLNNPAESATRKLMSLLDDLSPILFLSSGGSSLSILSHVDTNVLDESVTVGVLDERFSQDVSVNNFLQVADTSFGQAAQASGCNFINTKPKSDEDMEDLAKRFEQDIRQWKEANPNGGVVATVGIGSDGHVAGIMPSQKEDLFKERFQSDAYVAAYEVSPETNEHTKRVTTTVTFFRECLDKSIVFAVGKRKCPVLRKLFSKDAPLHEMPSQIIKEVEGGIFTDCNLVTSS